MRTQRTLYFPKVYALVPRYFGTRVLREHVLNENRRIITAIFLRRFRRFALAKTALSTRSAIKYNFEHAREYITRYDLYTLRQELYKYVIDSRFLSNPLSHQRIEML